MTLNQAKYDEAVNEMKQVASGDRGWVSLTAHAKTSGVSKQQLSIVAKALHLDVENHGKYGMTATKHS